jgi:hypothetical protein
VAAGAAAGLMAAGAAAWWLLRPKLLEADPVDVVALRELEALKTEPETGATLSRTSQVLRHYISAALGLPAGELTTKEVCKALATNERMGPELSGALAEFLRRNDERKFSSDGAGPALGAVAQAMTLITRTEAHRVQLKRTGTSLPTATPARN